MELLQLKYFCDAAITENFSFTAKKFTVPPSNISQSIKRLENELGVSLFDRDSNRIRLNANGKSFYDKISAALCLIDEARDALSDDSARGRIKICVNASRRIVMQTVEKFNRLYPEVDINTEYGADAGNPEFDLVITGKLLEYSHLSGVRLATEEIGLAVSKDSKLAKLERIDVSDLKNESFVAMGDKSHLHELTKKICADFGFEPHVVIQGDDPFYVRKCVEMGLGISFVPMLSWKGQFANNVAIKKIGDYTRDTYVWKNTKKHTSKCVRDFLDMLVDEFDSEAK